MRVLVAALALFAVGGEGAFAEKRNLPRKDCDPSFIRAWRKDKEAAMAQLPKAPCLMKTSSGPYVCYDEGCSRKHVYISD